MAPKAKAKAPAGRSKSPAKKPAGKAAAKPKKEAPPPPDPKQVAAATVIQRHMRGFLARKKLKKMKSDKKNMEEEMQKLRQQAYIAEVEYERKQDAKRRKKEQEERARKAAEAKLRKELLEAAYDGEEADVERLLQDEVAHVEMADTHGNTLLSEAAAGGALNIITLLVGRGADPNTQGEFKRTALWRACFLGHLECIGPLLEAGADPRIGNDGGELPEHVASKAEIKELIKEWDISKTERLVANINRAKADKEAAAQAKVDAAIAEKQGGVAKTKEAYDRDQANLKNARKELEKRITEYDTVIAERKPEELQKAVLDTVKQAEQTLANLQSVANKSAEEYRAAKFALREQMDAEGIVDEEAVGKLVNLKDLDEVLIRDVGNKIKESGKYPMVIDVSGQASVFLRYLDTNYVNVCSAQNMDPNRLRRSILGAFRYGKPVVVDFMDVDMLDEVMKAFDVIQPNLWMDIVSKKILQNEGYLRLVRKDDGKEYEPNNFQDARVEKFNFIVLTSNREPDDRLVQQSTALRVKVQQ